MKMPYDPQYPDGISPQSLANHLRSKAQKDLEETRSLYIKELEEARKEVERLTKLVFAYDILLYKR